MSKSDFLTNLIVIETKGRSMGMQMRREAAVARQELADRKDFTHWRFRPKLPKR